MSVNFNDKKAAVMAVLSQFDLDSSAVWNCHGTPVILHKALESVADKAGIEFDPPAMIETSAEKKVAVICVTGRRGEKSAWSFGEAMPSNNKNSYPFAMAEKRAKDRVILKLIGLSGDAYSEDEADDFKAAKPKPQSQPENQNKRMSKTDEARKTFTRIKDAISSKKSIPELDKFMSNHHTKAALASLPEDWERDIKAAISTQEHMLSMAAADNHEKEHA